MEVTKEFEVDIRALQKLKTDYKIARGNLINKLFRLLYDPIRRAYEIDNKTWSKYPETEIIPWSKGLVFSAFDKETLTFRTEAKPWIITMGYNKSTSSDQESLKKMVSYVSRLWIGVATFEAQYIDGGRELELKVLFI